MAQREGSLRKITIRSSVVNAAGGLLVKALTLAQTLLFVRVFLPGDIGSYATATLVMSGVMLFSQLGYDQAIIRKRDEDYPAMDTALYLSLAVALPLALAVVVLAPLAARTFGEPALTNQVRFLSFLALGNALSLPSALWVKRFQFGISRLPQIADIALSTAFTLSAQRMFQAGVWSLLIGRGAGFVANYGLMWLLAPYRPRPRYRKEVAAGLAVFGWPIMVGAVANYLIYQGDDLLVRYYTNDEQLAFYTMSFALPFYLKQLTDMVIAALLPSYSILQDSDARIENAFRQANKYLAVLLAPAGVVMYVFADRVVEVLYGSRWASSVPFLRIFAVSFSIDIATGYSWGIIALARAKTKYLMYVKLANVVILATAGNYFIWKRGPMGGALYTLYQVVLFAAFVRLPFIYRELGSARYLLDVLRPGAAMVLAAIPVGAIAGAIAQPTLALVAGCASYLIVYLALLALLDRSSVHVLREILTSHR